MKRTVKLLGLAILFLSLIGVMLTGCGTDSNNDPAPTASVMPVPPEELDIVELEAEEVEEPDAEAEPETTEPEAEKTTVPGSQGLAWLVPPTLEFDRVFYCGECDLFSLGDHSGRLIDRETGTLGGDNPGLGHGIGGPLFFDPERNLFGSVELGGMALFPFDELFEHFPFFTGLLTTVAQVDSSIRDGNDDMEWLAPAAFTGRYAVMYDGRFVTDFVFDSPESWGRHLLALRRGGSWGLINRQGEEALPFIFEHIIHDNTFAFIRYNGRYGIVDIRPLGLS